MQNVHMQIAIIIDCRLGIALSRVFRIHIHPVCCYFIEKHLNHKIQFTHVKLSIGNAHKVLWRMPNADAMQWRCIIFSENCNCKMESNRFGSVRSVGWIVTISWCIFYDLSRFVLFSRFVRCVSLPVALIPAQTEFETERCVSNYHFLCK